MEFTVVKNFIDKNTNVLHKTDTPYKTSDQTRADQLKQLGFIKDKEDGVPKKDNEKSILDKNVKEITEKVTSETPENELEALLEAEKKGKNRVTVIEHIESLLVEQ